MNKRWLRLTAIVAEREIRQRGRSRAFMVSTIVLLLVVAAGVVIPAILAHTAKPQRVGIVGGQTAAMTEIVREAGHLTGTGVTVVPQPSLASAEAALRSGQLDVVLANDSEVVVKQVSVADSSGSGGGLASAIADVAGLSRLLGQLPPGAADRGVTLPVRGLSPPSASLSRRLTGLFTVVLVWILISAYGSQIAMGVGEEKQNRIVEVILASVRPLQLLVGKVTGIGVLALAQAALMVVAFLGLGAAVGSSLVHGAAPGIVICGAVFLVLGYAFYCTAYAAAGSLVSRQSDVGAVILPVQVPLIIAYALSYTVIYADGANVFYRVLGFLPPTAPIAMPVLYAAGDVPGWQAAVSAVLVAAGTVWMARTAATIYGRSILRTGSRVRLRQVLGRAPAARVTPAELPAVFADRAGHRGECPGGQAAVGRAVLGRRVRVVDAPESVRGGRAGRPAVRPGPRPGGRGGPELGLAGRAGLAGDRGRLLPGRPGQGTQAEHRPRRRRGPGGLGRRRPERVRARPFGLRPRAHRLPAGRRGPARTGAG